MNESQAIDALAALAHQTRLQIIRHLVVKGQNGDSAGEIGSAVDASPSKITFHISALERAGLVGSERVSRQIIYRIHFQQLGALLNYLVEDCCANHQELRGCCNVETDNCRSSGSDK